MITERGAVLGIWLFLIIGALLLFPVSNVPNSMNSWDVLHSGRQFADVGFFASKLQPRWVPLYHPAPYLTYTHYPPLPFWISGVVQSLVASPQTRIRAMLRLTLAVGIGAVVCAYLLLRQLDLSRGAAAMAAALLLWSQRWWEWSRGELTWCSWLELFMLGGAAVMCWALRRENATWRIGLVGWVACSLAADLSAFDAWLWFPTFLAALLVLVPRKLLNDTENTLRRPQSTVTRSTGRAKARAPLSPGDVRRRLLWALLLASLATGVGIATRLTLNWWHFGSVQKVMQDVAEAYGVRSTFAYDGLQTIENQANFTGVPREAPVSRWQWLGGFCSTFPARAASAFLPASNAGWILCGLVVVLAIPGWAARGRGAGHGEALEARGGVLQSPGGVTPRSWPNAVTLLIAAVAAPMPFVLICPAISAQQWGAMLTYTPAVVIAAGLVAEGALTLVGGLLARVIGAPGSRWTDATVVAAVLVSAIVRMEAAGVKDWPAPLDQTRAAVAALSRLDGVVFVNLQDTNPFMYLAPLDSRVALKPAGLQRQFFTSLRPIRLLFIDAVGGGKPEQLASFDAVDLPGLPSGWRFMSYGGS